jgi:Icc-related predicted phosphoesterase
MKIQVLSDLHLEFIRNLDELDIFLEHLVPLNSNDREVLIIAGDLGVISGSNVEFGTIVSALKFFCKHYKRVFYVLGNHEFYHSDIVGSQEFYREIEHVVNVLGNVGRLDRDNLCLLIRERVEYKGVSFAGCTLWFNERPENFLNTSLINDFEFIDEEIDMFHEESSRDLNFLKSCIEDTDIVITHHLPTFQSVDNRFKSKRSNLFYVNDEAERLLSRISRPPAVWIHGHTHGSKDYMLGETRIICNPGGYPHKAENPNFNPILTFEV